MLASILHFSPTIFHKIAGVSGALAIALGAYGAHAKSLNEEDAKKYKESFMTGNLYHHIHNLLILATPFAKRPNLLLFSWTEKGQIIWKASSIWRILPYGWMASFCNLNTWRRWVYSHSAG
ncbi:transmembrane protein 256 homolog [Stylophora pistillata]|uniref:transmembrane protein 256 homolog n=1 Tax=Stylophora pistillata TaxID=50429 RepID=UPI000C04FC68|nr:transmembrane protein 256 homolog [Stylophora pistillata]